MEVAHHIRAALNLAGAGVLLLLALAGAAAHADTTSPPWLEGYAARFELQITGPADRAVCQSALATLPTGGLCRADAGDITVQTPDGKVLPVTILSHTPGQHTIIQFPRQAGIYRYFASVGHPTAVGERGPGLPEGLTLEIRQWDNLPMDDWPQMRDGLAKAPLLDSFQVAEIIQSSNPARPSDPLNFSASYRGYLRIDQAGPYRFLVNSDDAAFLFIDDFLVCQRPGQNLPLRGQVSVADTGGVIELTKGVHRIEVHHAVSNRNSAYGLCALMWFPQGQKGERQRWELVDKEHFVQADHARVARVQFAAERPGAIFAHGLDDSLTTQTGMKLYLVRFAAHADPLPSDEQLHWDFGDGQIGVGRQPLHVYFTAGDFTVKLRVGDAGPVFQQRVHVWPSPGKTSPFSPGNVVEWFAAQNWRQGELDRVYQMFDFLLICDYAQRWPLMAQVTAYLLEQNDSDPQLRADLYNARIEALGQIGQANEALQAADQAIEQFARLPTQRLTLQLAKARVLHRQLRDLGRAGQLYEAIIAEHRRLDDPQLRLAAIRWGDVCSDAGDQSQAARCYRLAQTLGGSAYQTTAVTEAISRGAQMRVIEQTLNKGDLRQTIDLLRKLEMRQPEQKLSGLYRLIAGETARLTGRHEDALTDYEALLRMTQWAGYHDRATFGIADTYRRKTDLSRAQQWLDTLRQTYPNYGVKEQLDQYASLLKLATERQGQGVWPMQAVTDDFEPRDGKPHGPIGVYRVAPGLGLAGATIGLMDNHGKYIGYMDYELPLRNLVPGGWYWVEMWYRESLLQSRHRYYAHIHTYLQDEAGKMHDGFHNEGTMYFQRTYGQWRKFGFMHTAPPTVDGKLSFSLRHSWGDIEVDGLSIRRVTDAQHAALFNFIEGAGQETEPSDE